MIRLPPRSTLFPHDALAISVQQCETIYLIATELGAPVYEKCGFETETEYLYFKDLKPIEGVSPSPFIQPDRKSTRLNSSHSQISYAVFCLKKKTKAKI